MFQVVNKDHNSLMDAEFFDNLKTVYDIKRDVDTNELTFLFYDHEEKKWYYESAENYAPLANSYR